ncbi:MAG: hypothetical protein ABI639_07035 [Thermoanaerobaculia bacterium]
MFPRLRLIAASAAIGIWLALFFLGRTGGGAIHLLAIAAILLLLWPNRSAPLPISKESSR